MLNVRKFITALVIGLVLSLALLTTGFAQTTNHTQKAVATHISTPNCGGCGWGGGWGGWNGGWGGGWWGW